MSKEELYNLLVKKEKIDTFIDKINNNDLIMSLFLICENKDDITRYQAEKVIRKLSEVNPTILYPFYDRMFNFLDSKDSFIKYGFIISIPNMLPSDLCNKWSFIRIKYLKFLTSTKVIEFSNVVKEIPIILKYHREEEQKIIPVLLDINNHTFLNRGKLSHKCIDIAKSAIMDCFYKIYEHSKYKDEIMLFVLENKNSKKSQIVNKANRFIKKYGGK